VKKIGFAVKIGSIESLFCGIGVEIDGSHLVGVARPHAGAEPVDAVVGDCDGFFFSTRGGYTGHRAKDFLCLG
jgi:hypothetical protein